MVQLWHGGAFLVRRTFVRTLPRHFKQRLRTKMSPPASQSFKISVKLNSQSSLSDLADQTRKRIFSKLDIKTIPYGDGSGSDRAANPLDVVDRLNERLRIIIGKCEQFAHKHTITLIVSINGGWTLKTAKLNLLGSLFFECEEAKLAKAVQDAIDDLKEFKRKAGIAARIERENKIVEEALQRMLPILAISEYCSIWPTFNKDTNSFQFDAIQCGSTHPMEPLKEDEYLWDPEIQKGEIRRLLHANMSSGFPFTFYYYKWHIYRDDPEDFDSAEIEFRNLLDDDDDVSDSDTNLGQRLVRERREAYQRAIREAGGALSFAANFFFDHVVEKALYVIPVVGEAMMVYDLAQLAAELPDDVRIFSRILLDEEEI
jgi:hypothetical protein